MLRLGAHEFVNKTTPVQHVRRDVWPRLTGPQVVSHNEPPVARGDLNDMPRSVSRMLRALILAVVMLVATSPARAAGNIEGCRNARENPVAGLAACETVIADDNITV